MRNRIRGGVRTPKAEDGHSNEELARLLLHKGTETKASQHTPAQEFKPPTPRPVTDLRQRWPLGESKVELAPLSSREEQALFAALRRGTKSNLGREPTLAELLLARDQANRARDFVRSVAHAIQSNQGLYVEQGRIVFPGPELSQANAQELQAA